MSRPTDLVVALPFVLLGFWLVYDVTVAFLWPGKNPPPTITRRTQELSRQYPAIPFAYGFLGGLLAGHFWGNF